MLLLSVLAEVEELAPLVMPLWAFPAIGIAFFAGVGFISWSYRDVANRHSNKSSDTTSHGAGH